VSAAEAIETFPCFGSRCSVRVGGEARSGTADEAARRSRAQLLDWHSRFSRFEPDSELSRLNDDPRELVPVSAVMASLVRAVRTAGALSGGLVDGTLLEQIRSSGYRADLGEPVPLADALARAPRRRPARPRQQSEWSRVAITGDGSSARRPPGVQIDSGGLAKGLFADLLAERLAEHACFAVDCGGDIAIGGRAGLARPVHVESPFDGSRLHTFQLVAGGVATSGIGRRSWLDERGRTAHHLLDPADGRPAFTGIVQVTALAPDALTAEIRAKAAILSGPRAASRWLPDGGVVVLDDASHVVVEPPARVTLGELARFAPAA
jgi:thiamine biosynthesis lipoprotein